MQTKLRGMLRILVCVVAAVILTIPAWAGGEVYVVGAELNGNADYMGSYGDGSFSSLEVMQITQDTGITAYPETYGNGLGDFDNDGEYDYIVGLGEVLGSGLEDDLGFIYISKKTGPGNQFAPPVQVASWNQGFYSMDMAVADFNGDGNQDFVMSYMGSPNSGLYLGDGKFGFTYYVLENTAPIYSAGIDAADFNNDGLVDFVVAPNSDEQIYVNLNNGNGTFTTQTFNTHDGNAVYGIAAADFINNGGEADINNDGIADIVTAYYDNLIIYAGLGDGTFQWSATYEFDLNQSGLDNYDFDGDGNQDLVAADFGEATDGIAVLLNNGDGTFRLDAIYPGTNPDPNTFRYLNAVTAPPYEQPKPDSEQPKPELESISVKVAFTPHTLFTPHTIFAPHKLNLNSRGKWITATIFVPDGYDARQIDMDSVQIVMDDGPTISANTDNEYGFFMKLFKNYRSRDSLTVKFNRKAVSDVLDGASGAVLLKVEGQLGSDGNLVNFSGEGTIQIIKEHGE